MCERYADGLAHEAPRLREAIDAMLVSLLEQRAASRAMDARYERLMLLMQALHTMRAHPFVRADRAVKAYPERPPERVWRS
jgi:hypothetical protein